MKVTGISYGRTIVVGDESFKQGKIWFGYEAELSEGEDVGEAIRTIRMAADDWEQKERDEYATRQHRRRNGR